MTYDNNDIMNFAKCWTGFGKQLTRANIEASRNGDSSNMIDPMPILPKRRDPFPKLTLSGVNSATKMYLGDSYPLCVDSNTSETACVELAFFTNGKQAKYTLRSGRVCANTELGFDESDLTTTDCTVQAQVHSDGKISIVHDTAMGFCADRGYLFDNSHLCPNVVHQFQVKWQNDAHPTVASGCPANCTVRAHTNSCLCTPTLAMTPVYIANTYMPSRNELQTSLHIGSVAPGSNHTQCTTSVCTSRSDVWAFLKNGLNPTFDADTIFMIHTDITGESQYYRNIEARVLIENYSFRNPPHFVSFVTPTVEAAAAETETVIDQMFYHDNMAPFIAHSLIQRLVTSNPSPRYVQAVATAFRSGKYNGHEYSKHYGDLTATVTAVFMDQEARSTLLDLDRTFGGTREPIVTLIHFMRAMELTTDGHEVILNDMQEKIAQEMGNSPSVFNFYEKDHQPEGLVQNAGITSPELQLKTAPLLVAFLNGISSLVDYGLSHCSNGFGLWRRAWTNCDRISTTEGGQGRADGYLNYTAASSASASEIVEELDLLLTAGRLSDSSRELLLSSVGTDPSLKVLMWQQRTSAFYVSD